MGLFKKIKNVVKKATKAAINPMDALSGANQAPVPQAEAAVAAAPVDVPKKETEEAVDESNTESARKKARSGGKKSLSVARSSGGGINL